MASAIVESSFSRIILHTKEEILRWVDETGGDVYVPEGRPYKGQYIYSGVYDTNTGERVDQNVVVATLGEYLDLLEKHGRKYEYYQIVKDRHMFLVPSHVFTMTKFVRCVFPHTYHAMGSPPKVKFNTTKWDFRVWSKTDHLDKRKFTYTIPSEIGKILIGPKGAVTKEFHARTGCSFTIKYNHKTKETYFVLYANPLVEVDARYLAERMIYFASRYGKIPPLPTFYYHGHTPTVTPTREDTTVPVASSAYHAPPPQFHARGDHHAGHVAHAAIPAPAPTSRVYSPTPSPSTCTCGGVRVGAVPAPATLVPPPTIGVDGSTRAVPAHLVPPPTLDGSVGTRAVPALHVPTL